MTEQRGMKRVRHPWLVATVLAAGFSSTACLETDDPSESRYFFGDVYDGVTGVRLKAYNIELEYFGRRYQGELDGRGGFSLPAVPPNHDYSVYIDAKGYRPFVSHQAQYADVVHADRSFHFEAYMFATSATVEDVPVTVTLSDSPQMPSGGVRLRPTSFSALYDEGLEQPSGVPGQVWENDNDILAKSVWVDFKDGAATLPGKDLVYGVPYQVSLLNVPGYQIDQDTLSFQAGVDGRLAITLRPLTSTPLAVAYMSTWDGVPAADGTLTIVLNQAAEFDPLANLGGIRESIDNSFGIDSENSNQNNVFNTLNDNLDPNLQERGTSIELNGQTIVIRWDKSRGLRTVDPGDVIRAVQYGGLDAVRIRRVGGHAADVTTLSALVGASTVTVVVAP